MEFKGSRTEKNLLTAFAGESQARTRYSFFASAARKEGYEQIGSAFQQTSDEEKEHAKLFFKQLKGGDVEITAAYPAGVIGATNDNLRAAAQGEKMEWGTLFPAFAKAAEEEGFKDIANLFKQVAKVEA
jgi:rubrerythrin